MALVPASHRFGPAEIGGSARVHQGDKNVSNTYYICKAVFSSAQPLHDYAGVSKKRSRDDQDDSSDRCACRSKRCRVSPDDVVEQNNHLLGRTLPENTTLVPLLKRPFQHTEDLDEEGRKRAKHVERQRGNHSTLYDHSISQQEFEEGSHRTLIDPPPSGHNGPQDNAFAAFVSAANQIDTSQKGVLLIVLEKIRQVLYSPVIPRSFFAYTTVDHATPILGSSVPEHHNRVIDTLRGNRIHQPVQEMVVTCVFLLSCLTYRNVSGKDILKIVAKCQEDRMLPLLTWLFGLGLARYLYLRQISRSLSGLTGDCIILEDAFQQQRRVPMSTCEHFSILKAFLELHYQGRPGEPLVKAGQFNMTWGSRRGLAIRSSDWATKGHIQAGSNVVMSIYVRSDDAKCIECQTALTVTQMGEFFW